MRAPITAPSQSPPDGEKGRNESRKLQLQACPTGTAAAGGTRQSRRCTEWTPSSAGAVLLLYCSTRSCSSAR